MFPTAGMLSWWEDNKILTLKNVFGKNLQTDMEKKGTDELIDLFGCEERREILPPLTKTISRSAQW